MKRIILKIFLLSFYISFSVGKNEIECGTNTRTSKLGKLIGGRPSHPKDWPWMAALLKVDDSTLVCGGVLITDRYVLTAANCFNDYNSDTRDNDIALLRLERPTSFSEFISPVCLPPRFETFETFETRRGTVVGWGTQEVGGNSSNILREISIPILRREDCESSFLGNLITPNMFCASQKGLDSCQGDSGGPLMIQQDDSRWYVVGIVSWGIGCALDTPGVYTKVNNYINWIRRNIEIPKTTLSPLTIYETEVKKDWIENRIQF
ncbi:Transmembrane protease serine 11D [Armadillidium nasatum]|uniref:Vitamin K-dependent protein C n=1 Tax=Armadillidium nasatum TaxID=96803 RepID=A0A5N5SLQ7_9CRUS|nr:Transmembrane protease serine 11D [Armadillidium nasatum]